MEPGKDLQHQLHAGKELRQSLSHRLIQIKTKKIENQKLRQAFSPDENQRSHRVHFRDDENAYLSYKPDQDFRSVAEDFPGDRKLSIYKDYLRVSNWGRASNYDDAMTRTQFR